MEGVSMGNDVDPKIVEEMVFDMADKIDAVIIDSDVRVALGAISNTFARVMVKCVKKESREKILGNYIALTRLLMNTYDSLEGAKQ